MNPNYRKYQNHKTVIDGIAFDSKLEANRYAELKVLEKAGIISQLQLQPSFELIPAFTKNGNKRKTTEVNVTQANFCEKKDYTETTAQTVPEYYEVPDENGGLPF